MQNQNILKFVWWEKSVEYQFIYEVIQSKRLNLLVPLDGNEEQLGDLVLVEDAKYVLIEFKRDIADFNSEYKKYKTNEDLEGKSNFSRAKESLGEHNHHLLVAGAIPDDGKPILILKIYKYFSCPPIPPNTPAEAIPLKMALDSGVSKEKFDEYALELSKFKTGRNDNEGTESSSSGGRTTSMVIGVSPTTGLTIIELEIYKKLALKLEPKVTSSHRKSP